MRSGIRSSSEKFHTSFCIATQALSSSRPRHLRISSSVDMLLFLRLRGLPELFHFAQRTLLQLAAASTYLLLYILKATLELAVGLLQSRFGIKLKITGDVDQHKKQVADFIFQSSFQFLRYLLLARASNPALRRARTRRRKFIQVVL